MSRAVDVLAVMDALIQLQGASGIGVRGTDAARAAVAELVEAANRAFPPGDYSQDMHGFAVRAALAKFGGAK